MFINGYKEKINKDVIYEKMKKGKIDFVDNVVGNKKESGMVNKEEWYEKKIMLKRLWYVDE
jgi:hypothetical protein